VDGRDGYEVLTTAIESALGGSAYLDDEMEAWLLGVLALL